MDQVEEDIETIHLYVVREGQKRSSPIPAIIWILVLLFLAAPGTVIPYQQPEIRETLRIPAVFFAKTFSAAEAIIPTGVKTYPATPAQGTLTITNGSVISQELPTGLIFTGADGKEVTTDAAVFVPPGSASGYGAATVSAHTLTSGKKGNIPALDINSVEGGSVYIRNLMAFTGGQDAWSVKVVTPQDKQTALVSAREYLAAWTIRTKALLESPCSESTVFGTMLGVTWLCRFAAYPRLPGYHINRVRIEGRNLLVDVAFTPYPRTFPGK